MNARARYAPPTPTPQPVAGKPKAEVHAGRGLARVPFAPTPPLCSAGPGETDVPAKGCHGRKIITFYSPQCDVIVGLDAWFLGSGWLFGQVSASCEPLTSPTNYTHITRTLHAPSVQTL